MKKETKDALYSLLDLIDVLGSVDFLKIDVDKANSIRKEVLDVIGDKEETITLDSSSSDLLGILPVILLDNSKFPTVKEVLNFAEKCLNIEIKNYWIKRSKAEVVGIIINEVNNQSPVQFNRFLKAWNKFNDDLPNIGKSITQSTDNKGFIEAWFKFFENYKGIE